MTLISKLPEPYKSLAELRREQSGIENDDRLDLAFLWEDTPEPEGFWSAVYDEERPVIPIKSIEDLRNRGTFSIPEYTGGSVSYYKTRVTITTTNQ